MPVVACYPVGERRPWLSRRVMTQPTGTNTSMAMKMSHKATFMSIVTSLAAAARLARADVARTPLVQRRR